MKPVQFQGDSLKRLRGFPREVRHDLGLQLYRLQLGRLPVDFKPMPVVGAGVEEIRVRDASGAYRVIYTARLADAIYVLHAFQKKTLATSKQDIELAATRFAALLRRNR
jgi:phage-related protein